MVSPGQAIQDPTPNLMVTLLPTMEARMGLQVEGIQPSIHQGKEDIQDPGHRDPMDTQQKE